MKGLSGMEAPANLVEICKFVSSCFKEVVSAQEERSIHGSGGRKGKKLFSPPKDKNFFRSTDALHVYIRLWNSMVILLG